MINCKAAIEYRLRMMITKLEMEAIVVSFVLNKILKLSKCGLITARLFVGLSIVFYSSID